MVKITYIDPQGTARSVDAEEGSTVMENAVRNGIPGIEAECGGACACATCHVYVAEEWREATESLSPWKRTCWTSPSMSEFASSGQIRVKPELDGLVVHTHHGRDEAAGESRSRNVGEQPSGFDPARYPAGRLARVGRRPSPVRVPDREAPGTPVRATPSRSAPRS